MKALGTKPTTPAEFLRRRIALVLDDAFQPGSMPRQWLLGPPTMDDLVEHLAKSIEQPEPQWRTLKEGEYIQPGDQWNRYADEWVTTECAGDMVDESAEGTYRRRVDAPTLEQIRAAVVEAPKQYRLLQPGEVVQPGDQCRRSAQSWDPDNFWEPVLTSVGTEVAVPGFFRREIPA